MFGEKYRLSGSELICAPNGNSNERAEGLTDESQHGALRCARERYSAVSVLRRVSPCFTAPLTRATCHTGEGGAYGLHFGIRNKPNRSE